MTLGLAVTLWQAPVDLGRSEPCSRGSWASAAHSVDRPHRCRARPAAAMDPFYLLLPRRRQLNRWPRLSQAALRRDGEELNEVSAQRHLFEESARVFPSATGKRAVAGAREEVRQLVAGKLGHELSRHQLA